MSNKFLARGLRFLCGDNPIEQREEPPSPTARPEILPSTTETLPQKEFSGTSPAGDSPSLSLAKDGFALPPPTVRFGFQFNVAKVEGKGEDSDPIAIWDQNWGVLAVFDGLGGAGSTVHHLNGMARTSAYIASRVAMSEINKRLSVPVFEPRLTIPLDISKLRDQLENALRSEAEFLDTESEPTRLKSKLIKRLPTTMAALFMAPVDETTLECQTVWAGDSRCYSLSSHAGLQQLSKDDIKSGGDALDNLKTDSPLSNYLNADTNFELHSTVTTFTQPLILLTATDGCFGYLLSPAHFEFLLLDTLAQTNNTLQWREEIIKRLKNIAGDDCSMALLALGWSSFDVLKADFRDRHTQLQEEFIRPLDDLTQKIERHAALLSRVESRKGEHETCREALRQELWHRYRTTHDQHLHSEIATPHPNTFNPALTLEGSKAEPADERVAERSVRSQSHKKDLNT